MLILTFNLQANLEENQADLIPRAEHWTEQGCRPQAGPPGLLKLPELQDPGSSYSNYFPEHHAYVD